MIRDIFYDLYCLLGDIGLVVLLLGLGIVKFGCDQGVKYFFGFIIFDDCEVVDLLVLVCDFGINLIDIVLVYGCSEECFGLLLCGQ